MKFQRVHPHFRGPANSSKRSGNTELNNSPIYHWARSLCFDLWQIVTSDMTQPDQYASILLFYVDHVRRISVNCIRHARVQLFISMPHYSCLFPATLSISHSYFWRTASDILYCMRCIEQCPPASSSYAYLWNANQLNFRRCLSQTVSLLSQL